jgi:peptidoglycan/LPS O-acetylase OafA/YrhL
MTFVFFKIQKNTSAIVIIIGCLAIKILSEVLGNLLHNDLGTWLHYICPLTRTADYFMGMALYIQIKEVMENPEEKKLLLWQIGSIFLYGSVCIYFTNKPIYSAIDIVTVLMLGVCLIKTRLTSILFENKIVLYFGSLGLELYLIHLPVIMMSESLLSKFGHLHIGMAKIAIMFIGTVFCAELYSRIANRIQQK